MLITTLFLSLALVIFGGVHFGRHVVRPILSRFRDSDNRRSDKFHNPSVGAVTHGAAFNLGGGGPVKRSPFHQGFEPAAHFTLRTAMKLKPKWIV